MGSPSPGTNADVTLLPIADGLAFTLRVCVLGFRTRLQHVDEALADLDAAVRRPADAAPGARAG
jgi:hypothetical protein